MSERGTIAYQTRDFGLFSVTQVGAVVIVGFKGRKTGDLYLAIKDHPVHCCQCSANFEPQGLPEHMWIHAPKRLQKRRQRAEEERK